MFFFGFFALYQTVASAVSDKKWLKFYASANDFVHQVYVKLRVSETIEAQAEKLVSCSQKFFVKDRNPIKDTDPT